MDFSNPDKALLHVDLNNAVDDWEVGLPGDYLFSSKGYGFRGYWMDANTFSFEIFDIGVQNQAAEFDGSRMS